MKEAKKMTNEELINETLGWIAMGFTVPSQLYAEMERRDLGQQIIANVEGTCLEEEVVALFG